MTYSVDMDGIDLDVTVDIFKGEPELRSVRAAKDILPLLSDDQKAAITQVIEHYIYEEEHGL